MKNLVKLAEVDSAQSLLPEVDMNYIEWGNFDTVKKIVEANCFYPIWITGNTGNGKTKMVEQACARAFLPSTFGAEKATAQIETLAKMSGKFGRKFIRVNFTQETTEDDLLGHIGLVNGDTVFEEGPVLTALREGAVLLLDEIDAGHTNRIMCLQSVLEGRGVHVKSINKWVPANKGFTIIATSNTKGRGSEDGRFLGTNIMNGAFLDRFAGMIEQDYPDTDVEFEILKRYFGTFCNSSDTYKNSLNGLSQEEIRARFKNDELAWFFKLTNWADGIRQSFKNEASTEVLTTRSLINIIQAYIVFLDKDKAMSLALERYPAEIKQAWLDQYRLLSTNLHAMDNK